MYFVQNKYVPAAVPFILRDDGTIVNLEGDDQKFIDIANVEMRLVNKNITRPGISYELYYWNEIWDYAMENIATEDKTIHFSNAVFSGLYLAKGPKRFEQLQRPFSIVDGIIEYW